MRDQYPEKINEILVKYAADLSTISTTDFSHKPLANKWSKKEILGHLVDSSINNYRRFISAEKKENLIFDGYDQDAWVIQNNYQNRDKQELISLFISVNKHIAYLIGSLSEEKLNRITTVHNFDKICMEPLEEREPSNLSYLIGDYIVHLEHHLRQIVGEGK